MAALVLDRSAMKPPKGNIVLQFLQDRRNDAMSEQEVDMPERLLLLVEFDPKTRLPPTVAIRRLYGLLIGY